MTGDQTPEQELTNSSESRNPQHGDTPTAIDGELESSGNPDHWSDSTHESPEDFSDEELAAYAADEDDDVGEAYGDESSDGSSGDTQSRQDSDGGLDDIDAQFTDDASTIHMEPTVKMTRPKDFLDFAAVEVRTGSASEAASDSTTETEKRPEPVVGDRPSNAKLPRPSFSREPGADTTTESTESPASESGSGEVVRDPRRTSNTRPRRPDAPRPDAPRTGDAKPPENRSGDRGVRRMRPPRGSARKAPVRAELPPALIQTLQNFATRVQNLESNTQKIARALVEIVKEGDNRKKAYDVLYGEMRQYKENFLWQAQKPLFMDLIKLFDSMLRVQRKYEALDEMEEVADDFIYLKEVLLETLYRYDIELIEEHPEKLDISIQKPVKRIDCDNKDEDRSVVQYIREGFTRDGMVLRPQEIVVKRYVEGKE